jgi:hypothetical protein
MDAPKTTERSSVAPRTGFTAQGYNGKEHDDVLRRVNRKPMTADGKQETVTTAGNVITVTMPNRSQWKLTLVEKTVPQPVTVDDVKTWEYQAAPAVAK